MYMQLRVQAGVVCGYWVVSTNGKLADVEMSRDMHVKF